MKPSVYIETTVISYLTARPHRDIVVAGHQQSTRDWWETASDRFELYASDVVLYEASAGDPTAANERLAVLQELPLLGISADARMLAANLVDSGAIPAKAAEDALHIAVAAVSGIQFLVTWNFRHIANATMEAQIAAMCRQAGYEPPVICSPEHLLKESEHHGVD